MFKTKRTIKHAKKPVHYIIRRVYHRWEMSSGTYVVIGDDLNEMAQIMDELTGNTETVIPPARPKSQAKRQKPAPKAKGSPRSRKKKTPPKKGRS